MQNAVTCSLVFRRRLHTFNAVGQHACCLFAILATFHWPPCWTRPHLPLQTALDWPRRTGMNQNWESYNQGGLSGPNCPLHSDDSAALYQVGEARQWLHPSHFSLFSLVSLYTMYKEHSKTAAVSVSASQAGVCAKVVEHCLDQLWQVVVVLPAPVLPRIGVIEIHWPTVSCKRRS